MKRICYFLVASVILIDGVTASWWSDLRPAQQKPWWQTLNLKKAPVAEPQAEESELAEAEVMESDLVEAEALEMDSAEVEVVASDKVEPEALEMDSAEAEVVSVKENLNAKVELKEAGEALINSGSLPEEPAPEMPLPPQKTLVSRIERIATSHETRKHIRMPERTRRLSARSNEIAPENDLKYIVSRKAKF
jgi:hypothetical protein